MAIVDSRHADDRNFNANDVQCSSPEIPPGPLAYAKIRWEDPCHLAELQMGEVGHSLNWTATNQTSDEYVAHSYHDPSCVLGYGLKRKSWD